MLIIIISACVSDDSGGAVLVMDGMLYKLCFNVSQNLSLQESTVILFHFHFKHFKKYYLKNHTVAHIYAPT